MWLSDTSFSLRGAAGLFAVALFALPAAGRTLMTQDQALKSAFPAGTTVVRQPLFLSKAQLAAAKKASGVEFDDELMVRYVGRRGSEVVGYVYFDAHRVRTLPETLMFVITPDARIQRIEILSFSEPTDYFPKERWIEQFHGQKLGDNLSLRKEIRPISGATLTGRAITNASRKILAIHQAVQEVR